MTTHPITGAAFYYRKRTVTNPAQPSDVSIEAIFPDLPGFTAHAPNRQVLEKTLSSQLNAHLSTLMQQGETIPVPVPRGGPYSRVILRPTDAVILSLWRRYMALSPEARSSWVSWAAKYSHKHEKFVLHFFRLGWNHTSEMLFAYAASLGFKFQLVSSPVVA